jgi:8-oxo-dGTP diphosphatase
LLKVANNIYKTAMTGESPKVRVGVGVFILQSLHESPTNPCFLIGKRKGSHGAGTYALPGGHLEFGESPEECAIRELMEETGMKVTNIRFLTATNDLMEIENKHYITLLVVCERENADAQPQIMEIDKCEGWAWVTWDTLLEWIRSGSQTDRKVFTPLVSLIEQRPGLVPLGVDQVRYVVL